jgi:hypothetical protein
MQYGSASINIVVIQHSIGVNRVESRKRQFRAQAAVEPTPRHDACDAEPNDA